MSETKSPKLAPKPGRVVVYRALCDYMARNERELSVTEGDLLYISDNSRDIQWWSAKCGGRSGLIPQKYVLSVMMAEYIEYPLHDAAKRGNINFVKECLENVSANALDKSGSTPLHWSSHGGHSQVVKLLCSVPNMCISAQNKIGDTALHAAAWKGHLECARILLEHGANTSVLNNEKKRPVDVACDLEIRALIELAMRGTTDNCQNEYISESDDTDN
ncbi:unnamed protein product [Thelazia callipaeda]|uniref:Osteoclast-stimulating factor 1 n=1 Tax=Thelazia callipaeda TaxID=103827 RepID=A0A0N5CL30_THECL|nr:unnamed protein product [Thelazia callipaeda]